MLAGLARAAAVVLSASSLAVIAADLRAQEAPVRVGIYQNAPKLFVDDQGAAKGFFPEIIDHLAKRNGWRVTYVPCEWAACLKMVETGEIDIMPDVARSPARERRFRFGHEAVFQGWSHVYAPRGATIGSLSDLDGLRVAVMEDSIQHKTVLALPKDRGVTPTVVTTDSLAGVLAAVHEGRADAGIVNQFFGEANEKKFNLTRSDIIFRPSGLFLAYSKSFDQGQIRAIDASISRMKGDPKSAYYEALHKWLKPLPFWTVTRVAWILGAVIVVLFALIVWWRYRVGVRRIRESRDSEKRLRDSEDLLGSIIENVPVGLLIKGPDHVVERANGTYLSWYGFDALTMLGRRSDEIEDFQSAEEAEFMNAQEREVLTTGRILARQVERLFTDGQIHTVHITKFPVYDRLGNITKVGSVSVDMTDEVQAREALAQSESRFRDFAESSSDWFWEMDKDLRFSYFSERTREIVGFDPSIYLGMTRTAITTETTDDEKWRRHNNDLESHRPFRDFRYDLKSADGSRLTISISGKPLFEEDGTFLGYRGTGTDITEQKRAEETRDDALREAERANLAKSDFLATMSHEFRTPLNAILGFSQMMRAEYFGPLGDDKYRDHAEAIQDAGQHMLALVNDVLDISAIEAGKRTFVKTAIDVRQLLEGCVKDTESVADERNIDVSVDVPDGLPSLTADERSVTQIVLNLLSNAIKFTDPKGTVSVSAAANNGVMAISVRDTGVGIPADELPNILNPFAQVGSDTQIAREGTGLGLSIVKSLVEGHDGRLTIESEVDVGTTVTVEFPIGAS